MNRLNIYRTARNYAEMTQADASQKLFIGIRTLSDYETGKAVPKDDAVCRMVEVYGTPWLAYEYLSMETEVGRRFLPRLEVGNLPQCVLRLQKEMDDVIRLRESMVGIAVDGYIDKKEVPEWEHIRGELQDLVRASLMLIFSKKEKGLRSL